MGKKGGRTSHRKNKSDKTSSRYEHHAFSADDMDDEIDAFHKQRNLVPLDINDNDGESDEDDELPVFDIKDIDNDEDEDEGDEDEDDDANDDVAKMIRQRKYLRAKFGGGEMHNDDNDEEDEEDYRKHAFAGKSFAHGADNWNFELQSSDDEDPKEEEELALQIQREKAKSLTMEDYDLVDISKDKDQDKEKLTLKDVSDKGTGTKSPDGDITFKVEDLNILSKEEQMNVLNRSAPELVCWLSELNDAHKQLENKINPFLSKVKSGEIIMEGGVRYFELKQLLMLSYCQAITFYFLLKSEGQPVHDHPVLARVEEIKKLLDQIKQIDSKLPVEPEDILIRSNGLETVVKSDNEIAPTKTDSLVKHQEQPFVTADLPEEAVPQEIIEIQKSKPSKDDLQKAGKDMHQKDRIGAKSLEMLKVRASLEEKSKRKGLYSSIAPKPSAALKRLRPVNGQLETYDDFDDDAVDVKGAATLVNGSSKVSQFLNASMKKPKVVSGDDDLPERDDLGERRRKHELQVLAGTGIKTEDDDDEMGDAGSDDVAGEEDDVKGDDSENEFYKQVEQQRAAKLAAKAATYSRKAAVVPTSLPETVQGKRHISSQIEKNRGLTRNRNKQKKNPRKNYRDKHNKAVKKRKGQVQGIKKPIAPYGGESSGINAAISRSIRFNG